MTVGPEQNSMLVFATAIPTTPNNRTSLITAPGVYYYMSSTDQWHNVNQVLNPVSLFSTKYDNAAMLVNRYTDGSGSTDFNNRSQISYIRYTGGTEVPFIASPYVQTRTADSNRGIKFIKSGVYSVTIQFTLVYLRDVAGDGPLSGTAPDRIGSQSTYNLVTNFLSSPATAYISNISHNSDLINIRLGSGLSRMSGVAVGNIIVKQDNIVEFIPEVTTHGFWVAQEELNGTPTIGNTTGVLSIHVTRVSDYTP
ncbi:hypothetical protein [Chryseobacterium tongliaoense]|uniref:hypothetical protein n=1 Tax=Chryseobacterium tongliaoense TaxID=3240933 RepID=UPI003514351E